MQIEKAYTLAEGGIMPRSIFVNTRKTAFTLAEVLITLGIIGIVAALTMPSLIAKHQEKEIVTKLKKVNSTLNQAYNLAKMENGETTNWFTSDDYKENAKIMGEKFQPYLKTLKVCGFESGCFQKGKLKSLTGVEHIDYDSRTDEYKMLLSDGTSLIFYWYEEAKPADTLYGNIKVDIDGLKGPHVWGRDTFIFNIYKNAIVPEGVESDNEFPEKCSRNSSNNENGVACAAWIIYNENMDYLKCDDLSWDGKTSCDSKLTKSVKSLLNRIHN